MTTNSYWVETQDLPSFESVSGNLSADVAVVGAGITGITAAMLLKRAGLKVVLLERDRCGGVDTSFTSGHLTQVTDLRLSPLVYRFGREVAQSVWEAGGAALDVMNSNHAAAAEAAGFRWVPAFLFHSPEQGLIATEDLREDAEAARAMDISVLWRDSAPPFGGPALQFPHQGLFHPRRYLNGLLASLPGDGCEVFEHSEVTQWDPSSETLSAGGHSIRVPWVVLATQTPQIGSTPLPQAAILESKLARYSTYVISGEVGHDVIPEGLYWDTAEPYHYLRVERGPKANRLILGGEDHKTGQKSDPSEAYRSLSRLFHTWFPTGELHHRWSGQVVETNDGLPYIGLLAERLFVATGFSGNGLTFGTLAGLMAVDQILGVNNPWIDLFSPNRIHWKGGTWSFVRENKDYPFYLIRDRLTPAPSDSVTELPRGEGRLISVEGHKVAAYRSLDGEITLCSPVCPHLKCIVRWNPTEQTWDCPCHGSRFQATGEVMSGPAQAPLQRLPLV